MVDDDDDTNSQWVKSELNLTQAEERAESTLNKAE